MNSRKKAGRLALGLTALVCWLDVARSEAIVNSSSTLNINVTITASRSVVVNGQNTSTTTYSWDPANPEQPVVPTASTVTVKNDSNVVEKWELSTLAESINTVTNGGATWSLATSSDVTGGARADKFSVQAVFGSSRTTVGAGGSAAKQCPDADDADWNTLAASTLTVVGQKYTSARFADSLLDQDGGLYAPDVASGNMYASNQRTLCWRVVPPSTTATLETQNVQIIVWAVP